MKLQFITAQSTFRSKLFSSSLGSIHNKHRITKEKSEGHQVFEYKK